MHWIRLHKVCLDDTWVVCPFVLSPSRQVPDFAFGVIWISIQTLTDTLSFLLSFPKAAQDSSLIPCPYPYNSHVKYDRLQASVWLPHWCLVSFVVKWGYETWALCVIPSPHWFSTCLTQAILVEKKTFKSISEMESEKAGDFVTSETCNFS